MASSFTTNKVLEKPANGDYVDTWNVPVNGDLDIIDQAFGGSTALNATGGSATLSSTQYRSLILLVSGAMSASVTYTIPAGVGGQWLIRNTTTDSSGGPFTVTFASGGGGTTVLAVRGSITSIFSDGTNIFSSGGTGTVTSVNVSGGSTGLTSSGGPITSSGTITIAGTLNAASGGTGLTSLPQNEVLIGSGTNAVTSVAPGSNGNVLTSNGSVWTSAAVGGVTSVSAGTGISVSGTTAVTVNVVTTLGAVGTYAYLASSTNASFTAGTTYAGSGLRYSGFQNNGYTSIISGDPASVSTTGGPEAPQGGTPSGTWQAMGTVAAGDKNRTATLFIRVS